MRQSLIFPLVLCLMVLGRPAFAGDPASSAPNPTNQNSSSRASKEATQAELDLLRGQVASQQRTMESQQETIEELKTMVGRLAQRLESNEARVLPASYDPLAQQPTTSEKSSLA